LLVNQKWPHGKLRGKPLRQLPLGQHRWHERISSRISLRIQSIVRNELAMRKIEENSKPKILFEFTRRHRVHQYFKRSLIATRQSRPQHGGNVMRSLKQRQLSQASTRLTHKLIGRELRVDAVDVVSQNTQRRRRQNLSE